MASIGISGRRRRRKKRSDPMEFVRQFSGATTMLGVYWETFMNVRSQKNQAIYEAKLRAADPAVWYDMEIALIQEANDIRTALMRAQAAGPNARLAAMNEYGKNRRNQVTAMVAMSGQQGRLLTDQAQWGHETQQEFLENVAVNEAAHRTLRNISAQTDPSAQRVNQTIAAAVGQQGNTPQARNAVNYAAYGLIESEVTEALGADNNELAQKWRTVQASLASQMTGGSYGGNPHIMMQTLYGPPPLEAFSALRQATQVYGAGTPIMSLEETEAYIGGIETVAGQHATALEAQLADIERRLGQVRGRQLHGEATTASLVAQASLPGAMLWQQRAPHPGRAIFDTLARDAVSDVHKKNALMNALEAHGGDLLAALGSFELQRGINYGTSRTRFYASSITKPGGNTIDMYTGMADAIHLQINEGNLVGAVTALSDLRDILALDPFRDTLGENLLGKRNYPVTSVNVTLEEVKTALENDNEEAAEAAVEAMRVLLDGLSQDFAGADHLRPSTELGLWNIEKINDLMSLLGRGDERGFMQGFQRMADQLERIPDAMRGDIGNAILEVHRLLLEEGIDPRQAVNNLNRIASTSGQMLDQMVERRNEDMEEYGLGIEVEPTPDPRDEIRTQLAGLLPGPINRLGLATLIEVRNMSTEEIGLSLEEAGAARTEISSSIADMRASGDDSEAAMRVIETLEEQEAGYTQFINWMTVVESENPDTRERVDDMIRGVYADTASVYEEHTDASSEDNQRKVMQWTRNAWRGTPASNILKNRRAEREASGIETRLRGETQIGEEPLDPPLPEWQLGEDPLFDPELREAMEPTP